MNRLLVLLFFICLGSKISSQAIGEWVDLLPYNNMISVTSSENKIFAATPLSYFSYDKKDLYTIRYSKVNGLSDIGVNIIKYDKTNEVLVVAYSNANIDLVFKDRIFNIQDIKQANIPGQKQINHIFFKGIYAYLSTSFGIVVVDLERKEIKDTYKIGPGGTEIKINATTATDNEIFASTDIGIFKASLTDGSNLLSFTSWHLQDQLTSKKSYSIINFNEKIIASLGDTLFQYENGNWSLYYTSKKWVSIHMSSGNNNLILTEVQKPQLAEPDSSRIARIDTAKNIQYILQNELSVPTQAIETENGTIYVSDVYQGLIKWENGKKEIIKPIGPYSSNVYDMAVKDGTLYIAPGGTDQSLLFTFNRDGFFTYNNYFWINYNRFSTPLLADYFDILKVAVNPVADEVVFGSLWNGLIFLNDNQFSTYNKDNSALAAPSGDPARTRILGLDYDRKGNLFVSNNYSDHPLVVFKPDKTSLKFRLPGNLNGTGELVLDNYNQAWVLLPMEGSAGVAVYDFGDDLESTADDRSMLVTTSGGNGALHTNEVTAIAKDKDGEIWLGTPAGIAIFNCPSDVIGGGCKAYRPLVEQDGYNAYLLDAEAVTTIAVDGANRKWIGTQNGVFLMSPDGTEQIEYFTEDNSPLLSNNIIDIAIDPGSGMVYIGTEKGLTGFRGTAVEGKDKHEDVMVYPNPVRENYTGPIAIKGLVKDADVRITDVSGNLIYRGQALGGQAIWDGKNYNGERAHTGVYLVFSTNNDGTETMVAKLLFIN